MPSEMIHSNLTKKGGFRSGRYQAPKRFAVISLQKGALRKWPTRASLIKGFVLRWALGFRDGRRQARKRFAVVYRKKGFHLKRPTLTEKKESTVTV